MFRREVARSIRDSLARFLAIMGIVALGCGFYSGLQMSGPDMREAADRWYDGTCLWDLRIISTLGFSDSDVERVRAVEGVEELTRARTTDVMASLGTEEIAVRITSLDMVAAKASTTEGDYIVVSDDPDYLNRPMLREGRWPETSDECVISADAIEGFTVGDTVEVLYGSSDIDDILARRSFKVVGAVSASDYPYTGNFGSTALGSGQIDEYLYVTDDAFVSELPYTEIYVCVAGAADELSESTAYQAVIDAVKERLDDRKSAFAAARQGDLKDEAQETLDEKKAEYEAERADAEAELDDAADELKDALAQLSDGEAEYADGKQEYDDGVSELASKRASAYAQLDDAKDTLSTSQKKLNANKNKLLKSLSSQGLSATNLSEAGSSVASAINQADDGLTQLATAISQLQEGIAAEEQLIDGLSQLDDGISEAQAGIDQLTSGISQTNAGLSRLDDGISEAQKAIDELTSGISEARSALDELTSGISEAQSALDELTSGISETQKAIDELTSGISEVQEVVDQLTKAKKSAGDAWTEDQESQLQAAQKQLESYEAQLATAQTTLSSLESRRATAQTTLSGLESRRATAQTTLSGLESRLATAQTTLSGLESRLATAQTTLSSLEAQRATAQTTLSGLESRLATATATLKDLKEQRARYQAQLDTLTEQLGDDPAATLKSLKARRRELIKSRKELDVAQESIKEIQQAQTQINTGFKELAQERAEVKSQLEDARLQLNDAAATLAESRAELDDAWADYEDGLAEYEDARTDAEKSFADAEHDLAEAQRVIDEIEMPDIYILDRSQSEGALTYHSDAGRMDSIADVFPLMFFLVAALVALTTMTRMVEDDRVEIGTYKALGYGTFTIASKYLVYAATASVAGALVGTLVLTQVLPLIIIHSYAIVYAVPLLPLPLPIDPIVALSAGGLGVGVTLIATWFAVVSSLRATPATLMLPRAPKPGKRILLEHITPLWRRFSFSWKVTARNLFRYKRRFAMTTIGIAGCSALLLVGFGLHNSIWDIIERQYGPIVHFDTTIGLDSSATTADVDQVVDYLRDETKLDYVVRVRQENMQAGSNLYSGNLHVAVVIPEDPAALVDALTFKDRATQRVVDFDDDSVFLTEKAAHLLELDVGDTLELYEQDKIGNATGKPFELTVSGIVENYVGNYVYVGRNVWQDARQDQQGEKLVFSTLYAKVGEDIDREQLAGDLHDLTGVSTVIFSDETIETYRSMLSVVDLVVVVLIVSAAALAFIVLYNLTNINIDERVREIASLKVLGFTRSEIYAYIFREILLLALLGDMLGMVLGSWLEHFVIVTAEVDYVMFGRVIHQSSYVYAFVLTLVFAGLVLLLMRHKLDRVSMVESLKSID